jgi:hypothetical protein
MPVDLPGESQEGAFLAHGADREYFDLAQDLFHPVIKYAS